ncbi:Pyruvate kinase [Tumidithrix helvetica PCC 7403]|uniref:pyruvate kinase n=1 Tax=Tumidithrix helvetica TaxID=3457545 RepID=UPI003C80F09D
MITAISKISTETFDLSSPDFLLSTLQALRQNVESEGQITFKEWRSHIQRPEFLSSALNLAQYLALRRHDLRSLQTALMPWGLSSLGRIEARVMPNLDAVIATLELICGSESAQHRPPIEAFFEGNRLLKLHTEELFGQTCPHRRVRIMVTLPTEAATDYDLVRKVIQRGANSIRINCAHDTPEIWKRTIEHVRRAEQETGTCCKVMMDLGGPKIRTGSVLAPLDKKRVFRGDRIVLSRCESAIAIASESSSDESIPVPVEHFQTCCTVPEILDLLTMGTTVYIDDGKIRTRAIDIQYPLSDGQTGILLEVTHASPKGVKLRPEKGLNFPNTVLPLSPLTEKDLSDLDFVAVHADIIGYSFVQRSADIELLQQELEKRSTGRVSRPAIVAKIETAIAVSNLPELIVHAAGKQSFGVMIARGDLAVEIGYQRLTEIQEEILWICEAAHVPVIWATQVLESLVKDGAPSRGEMTDAAMAERAECVMLNKGPFIAEAITILDDVLTRMEAHQSKKTPQLRALHSW